MKQSSINSRIRRASLVGLTGPALLVSGCENNDSDSDSPVTNTTKSATSEASWGIKKYSETGIAPQTGSYNFSAQGRFEVQSPATLKFSRDGYAFYSIPIKDGAFYYRNGCLVGSEENSDSGNLYPTDGFAISGHFISETEAEGSIAYSYSGSITEEAKPFVAIK
jgi:hypothetical protein